MTSSGPWAERIRLDQIGNGLKRHLVADADARSAIAHQLDLAELSRLEADLELKPAGAGWSLKGRVQADLVQTCGLTLEPLPDTIDGDLAIDLVEAGPDAPGEVDLEFDPDGPDGPDVVEDGGIDLVGYVVEWLALSIDPWPRKPGASFEAPSGPSEPSPFDVLRDLKPRT